MSPLKIPRDKFKLRLGDIQQKMPRIAKILIVIGAMLLTVIQYIPDMPNNDEISSHHSSYALVNATVYTMDSNVSQHRAHGFIVSNGLISQVLYDSDDVPEGIPIRNMNGKVIMPGFIDAHGHTLHLGYKMMRADLVDSKSIDDIKSRLKAYASSRDPAANRWIVGSGWDQTKWGSDFPSSSDLDSDPILKESFVVLYRIDYHAIWVNKKVLDLLEEQSAIDWTRSDILKGLDGHPTGIFLDDAMPLVESLIPSFTEKESFHALHLTSERLLKHGVVGVHDAGIYPDQLSILRSAYEQGISAYRNYVMITCRDPSQVCLPDNIQDYEMNDSNGLDLMSIKSVKLFLDGALGSWGAAMIEPYADQADNTGILRIPEGLIRNLTLKWMRKGFQVNVHAIGDRANRIALNAFQNARDSGVNLESLRPRIEHAQIIHPDDIPRFSDLHVMPSMQPTHATSDMDYVESRLGTHRAESSAYVWKSLIKNKSSRLPLGSDFPIEDVNPFKGIYAAITRTHEDGTSPHGLQGWFPDQKLTVYEAIKGFTMDAAYASFMENKTGSISAGKYADYIVVDTDPFTSKPHEILHTRVLETVIGGASRYRY